MPYRRLRPLSPQLPPRSALDERWHLETRGRRAPSRTTDDHITEGKGEGDHVSIAPERGTPPRSPARGPWPGGATSRRNIPRSAVTWQTLGWILPVAALLVCLGLLLGSTWTTQALQPRLRRHAEERRRLNEDWLAIRSTRRRGEKCPHCAYPLTDWDWHFEQTLMGHSPDDD